MIPCLSYLGDTMEIFSSIAPTRIDLAGGTLDIAPLFHILDNPCTVNLAVTLHAQVKIRIVDTEVYTVRSLDQQQEVTFNWSDVVDNEKLLWPRLLIQKLWHKDLPTFEMEIEAKSPAGAGLGGSSCLGIAIAGVLDRARQHYLDSDLLSELALVQLVQGCETKLIRVPTGCQDYWGGLRGGLNILEFPEDGLRVDTFRSELLEGLAEDLILCYSGKSRASGTNNWLIFKQAFDGDQRVLDGLNEIAGIASDMASAVRRSDREAIFALSSEEWSIRKSMWPSIETTETRRLSEAAHLAGASLARVCGAGGGGVMAIFCRKDVREAVVKSLIDNGGQILSGQASVEGLQTYKG